MEMTTLKAIVKLVLVPKDLMQHNPRFVQLSNREQSCFSQNQGVKLDPKEMLTKGPNRRGGGEGGGIPLMN